MAGIIASAVSQLKDRLLDFLHPQRLALVAGELGLEWRETVLALPNLVTLFARQVLLGNVSMPELARQAGSQFTPEAYCTARRRMPLELLQELLRRIVQWTGQHIGQDPGLLWKGHRLWHMDGSGFSMPDTPELQKHFGQPGGQKPGCGFPVAHVLCLFDAATGLIADCICSPLRTADVSGAHRLHPQMRRGDVLIADRAFQSFVHLALLLRQGLGAILPVHHKRKLDFRRKRQRCGRKGQRLSRQVLRKLGSCDQIVRWFKPKGKPRWMSQRLFDALPQTLDVRELKRTVLLPSGRQQTIVVITTLLDAQVYPPEELVGLLKDRWQVEINLRHLKTTMKMDVLRSKTVAGVRKELWMFLIVYNLVRWVMLAAARQQRVPVGRISFADALYWVRHGDLTRPLPVLAVVPDRPGRIEPRAYKRRHKEYDRLNRPRKVMRNRLRRRR